MIKVKIITLSDRAYKGIYNDESGDAAERLLCDFFKANHLEIEVSRVLIPDNEEMLRTEILQSVKVADMVITTGGTGIGPKDITPEVVNPLLQKEIPGIMELIRVKYGKDKPNALLSRSVAGIIQNTLIFTLPGSTKAVNEYLTEINKIILHCLDMLKGIDSH